MALNSPVWEAPTFGGYDPNRAFMQNMINPGMMRAEAIFRGGPVAPTGGVTPAGQPTESTGGHGAHGAPDQPEGRSMGNRIACGAVGAAATLGVIAATNCWNPLGWGTAGVAAICLGVGAICALF
jgi:hypothetical protein